MESNPKEYEEDKKKDELLQIEQIEQQVNTMKIESILPKEETKKDKENNNNHGFSSFDEDFYSDVSSENNDDFKSDNNSLNLKKIKTMKDYNNYNKKHQKELRRSNYIEKHLMLSITKKENTNRKNLELAKSINFKTIPDKIVETDEFGFLKTVERPGETPYIPNNEIKDQQNEEKIEKQEQDKNDKKSKEYLLLINSRTEKWIYMLEHYDVFSTKKFSKLKQRTRKGIPDSLRSNVWQLFAEMKKYYKKDIFNKFVGAKLDEDTEETIIKDLDRTYPSCQLFTDKYGNGQRKLYKILSCYSLYNKEVGYVQGMGFLVALFLIYMDEESSFFMLDS